jgi:TolA-binding protein
VIATAPEGLERTTARRRILRLAASRGCASCRAAVDAGLSESEWNPRSLYLFGLCAEHEHQLELARTAYGRAVSINADSNEASTVDTVRATSRLGVVRAALGDHDGARQAFQFVVSRWGNADRAIPEVEVARKALAK